MKHLLGIAAPRGVSDRAFGAAMTASLRLLKALGAR